MNWLLLISGLFGAITTIGHFTMGRKEYLIPMLEASFEEVPKKVMHCVFHYVSAYLILSTIVLLALGFGVTFSSDSSLLVWFIIIHYAVFAVTQIIIASTSRIEKVMFKMFQWIFFALIAVFAWLGL
ncbi:MAG: hypothetical protein GTN81_17220 [Proteobacteria bacterium]|nr:hypothetical protein [Pseudomonadota bacterium]